MKVFLWPVDPQFVALLLFIPPVGHCQKARTEKLERLRLEEEEEESNSEVPVEVAAVALSVAGSKRKR
jgi:hypothetical protein